MHITLSVRKEIKLRNAFMQVLLRIPQVDREAFFRENPIVFCEELLGSVECFAVPPLSQNDGIGELNMIFMRYDVVQRKDLIHIVAHEVAHMVRGGDHKRHLTNRTPYEDEKGADDLIKTWGFKPRYSKKRLAALRMESRRREFGYVR
jgi:hypothetical protein